MMVWVECTDYSEMIFVRQALCARYRVFMQMDLQKRNWLELILTIDGYNCS